MVVSELEEFRRRQTEQQRERKIIGRARRGFEKERQERAEGRREGFRSVLEFVPRKKKKVTKTRKRGKRVTARRGGPGPTASRIFGDGGMGRKLFGPAPRNNPGPVERETNIFRKLPPGF